MEKKHLNIIKLILGFLLLLISLYIITDMLIAQKSIGINRSNIYLMENSAFSNFSTLAGLLAIAGALLLKRK